MTAHVCLIPYMSLRSPIRIGPWQAQPIDDIPAEFWLDSALRTAVLELCARYVSRTDKPIANIAVCRRVDRRIGEGEWDPYEQRRLQLSLFFGLLAEQLSDLPVVGGWPRLMSADNTQLHVWPVDPLSDRFALEFGGYLRTLVGGFSRSNPRDLVRTPSEVPMDVTPMFDDLLATDAYNSMNSSELLRIGTQQLQRAWRNSSSVSFEDRIGHLKTGFEAIPRPGKRGADAPAEAQSLVERLRPLVSTGNLLINAELDGQVSAEERLNRLEYWYVDVFAKVRNAIVHDGKLGSDAMAAAKGIPSSPFDRGDLMLIASRVLCDLLRQELYATTSQLAIYSRSSRALRMAFEDAWKLHGMDQVPGSEELDLA